jgi:hypothetical protein
MRLFKTLTTTLVVFAFAATASAQATRTWVSGVGDDANPCSRTAPCKTFAGAISKTAAGGEISVLDPGGFGAVTITKSITINGDGTLGGILAAGTTGVIVNALSTDKIYLRNLTINGAGSALNGVRIMSASNVTIENCGIYNIGNTISNNGVSIQNTAANVEVAILNSTIRNVGGMGVIATSTAPFDAKVIIDNSHITDNASSGVNCDQNARIVISNSEISHNGSAGVYAERATCEMFVYNTMIARNVHGVFAGDGGGGTVRLYGSTITGNTANGIFIQAPAVVSTHTNNAIISNAGTQATNNSAGLQ